MIQHIRDEAHRFAITYHRKRLRRHNLVSILDQIEGIGPKRRQALWKAFPTLEGMRAASEEELAAVDGMTAPLARKLYEFSAAMWCKRRTCWEAGADRPRIRGKEEGNPWRFTR